MKNFVLELNEDEYKAVLSSLLFTSSVNFVLNNSDGFQNNTVNTLKKVKQMYPECMLDDVEYIKDEAFEDELSEELFNMFKDNVNVVSLEAV